MRSEVCVVHKKLRTKDDDITNGDPEPLVAVTVRHKAQVRQNKTFDVVS